MQYRNIDKQALKNNGYTVLAKISIVGTDTVFTEDDYIVDWDYEDYRYVPNTGFIGQFVERILDGNLQNISDGVILEDTEINLKLGIVNALDNNTTTWYDYGNFLVTKVEKTDTTGNYKFESADYTKKFNKVFDGDYTDATYTKSFNEKIEDGETVTALWLAQYVCKQAGVVLYTTNFTNYNFVISSNQYDSEDTLRKVMQDIGKLAYSWVRVAEDNKVHIDFTPKSTSSVDQYDQLTTDEYYVSKKSDLAFGPVNKVLIGMSDVEGENLYITSQDYTPETECAIKIYDNNLTNTEELRQTALQGAERLFGLTYTPVEINSVGHPWLDGDELIKLTNVDDEVVYTYPFNRKIHYAGYIEGVIGAEASSSQNSEYEYKSDIVSEVKRTTIIVNKQEQTITALAENVGENTSDISQLQIDLNGIDLRVQSVETTEVTGVTNEYAVNDSATTPPAESSSSWSTTKPTRGEGQYIWARIKTTYKSGNIAYSDPVNTTGDKGDGGGDGKGITSINVYYKTTPTQDEPSAASITSTTIPEMDATTNKYLWQKQVTNYNDSTSTTTVTLIGVYGDKGEDADPAIMYHNAVGTNITTEDAGELELKSINKLEGETEQDGTPTPDNPQEIKNVTGRQEVNIVGKNLFDLDLVNYDQHRVAIDNGVKLVDLWAGKVIDYTNLIKMLKPNTTYTSRTTAIIKARPSTINQTQRPLALYRSASGNIPYNFTQVVNIPNVGTQPLNTEIDVITTFTTPSVLDNLNMIGYTYFGNNDGSTTYVGSGEIELHNLMLVEGTYTQNNYPDFEPYKGKRYLINLGYNLAYPNWAENFVQRVNDNTLAKIETYDDRNCLVYKPSVGYSNYDTKYVFKIDFKENTQYTFKYDKYSTTSWGDMDIIYTDGTKQELTGLVANTWNNVIFTSQPNKTIKYLSSHWRANDLQYIDLDTFMVYEGVGSLPYAPYFASIELNEIGTYQDYIYKDNGSWYLHKEVGKVVLDGTDDNITGFSIGSTNTTRMIITLDEDIKVRDSYCNRLIYNSMWNKDEEGYYYDTITGNNPKTIIFRINKSTVGTTLQEAETYFTSNNLIFYYVKNIPTDTEITNTELITQLNTLEKAVLNEGINNIDVIGNLPMILDLDYWTYYKGETGRSVESITEEYALSTSSTTVTGTWSTDVPIMTSTNKYLWNRETITYANPTSSETGEPKIIGVYGLQGDAGKGIKSVTELYYVSNSSTAPAKPTSHVTTSSLVTYNQWNLQCPPYTTTYKYFYTCSEIEYDTNPVTYGWTNVTQNQGLAIANANANNALNTVNNLSIGGRNLLYYSDFKDTSYAPYYGVRNNYGTYTLINNGLKSGTNSIKVTLNFATGSSGTDMTMNLTIGNTLPDKEYSFSGWAKASENMTLYARLGYGANVLSTPIGTTWQRFKIEGIKSGNQVHNQLLPYCIATNSGASIQFACLKFEEGNKASDWTPAPEDTDATISALNTYVDNNVQNLQNQIDGAIQFWNGANIPTLNNYPANQWTTEAERTNHQADIYTVIQDVSGELKQGKSYRFDKVSGTWQWIELTDNELSAVQALASSKAKVYVTTPTVPYNIGDLWLNNNKLYRCKTAKDNSGSYAAADWELATDYTNDDTANTAIGLVNNLSIGGRNLITESTYTAAPSSNANWVAGTGNTISVSYTNGGRTGKVTNGNFGEIQLFTTLEQINCKATDNITFSCDVKLLPLDNESEPDVSDYVYLGYSLYYDGTSYSPNWYTGAQLKWDSTTKGAKYGEWTRLHIVFPGYTGTYNYQKLMFGVIARANQANSDIKFVIRNCKIERGNKPTDWTLAPEDISEEINDVNSNFSNYVTTEAYDSDWLTRKDEILGIVKGTYTTESDFGTYKQEMSTALNLKADSATIVATASDVVSNAISGIEETVNDINETFTFDTNGLTIARGSNTMYLRLQNNRLSFKTDESETGERAYMTSNEFVLKELQSFQIGTFKFEVRTNGSLDFKKV